MTIFTLGDRYMGKVSVVLVVLLLASLSLNIYFIHEPVRVDTGVLKERISALEEENRYLKMELYQTNISLQQAREQLATYREQLAELRGMINRTSASPESGSATLDAPAVMQRVEYSGEFPFYTRRIIEEGTMMKVSVDIKPGEGRVLVETTPLMGVVFQDAANNAVAAAENYLGCDLSGSDVIFSVKAEGEVPEVDGPSAGALMAILVIAAVENMTLPDDVTMTGTIRPDGHVGKIGGVVEKAKAAKASGKHIFILPEENSQLVRYEEVKKKYGGLVIITQRPVLVDAKDYIEENIGIRVEYVSSLKDILELLDTV